MKKIELILSIVGCLGLSACSDEMETIVAPEFANEDICCTSDDLLSLRADDAYDWQVLFPETRTSVNTITLHGYSSKTSSGNKKVYVQKNLATLMGISSQIYIMEYVTAYQDITITGLSKTSLYSPLDSPLCGVKPNGEGWEDRGYVAGSPTDEGKIRMTSMCVHIISDLSGRSYDLWYPCKPEKFEWQYTLVNL